MNITIIFQIATALLLIALMLLVFDIRFRGEKRVDGAPFPLLLGAFLPLYGLGYLLIIFYYLGSVTIFDWISFILILVGTFIVARSRLDLRGNYAWPGQFIEKPELIKTGIYTRMRHPVYTGVGIFLLGTLFTVVVHSDLVLGIPMTVLSATILALLVSVARYEESCLTRELGDVYVSYICEVHAVLPFYKAKREERYEEDESDLFE